MAGIMGERIIDATLRCVARWGVAKTTLDDIAREAGCSRATIYRTFPGGKESVLYASGEREVRRFLDTLAEQCAAQTTVEDLLATTLVASARAIRSHAALQYLLVHEPAIVLSAVAFDGLDPLLTLAREFGAPELERFLTAPAATATAEWTARVVVAHVLECERFDLTDPRDAHRLVATYVLPGLTPDLLAGASAA